MHRAILGLLKSRGATVVLCTHHVQWLSSCDLAVLLEDGKIADNWVMVDFPHVLAQLGVDVFDGEGWEAFDRGERQAPRPDRVKGERDG